MCVLLRLWSSLRVLQCSITVWTAAGVWPSVRVKLIQNQNSCRVHLMATLVLCFVLLCRGFLLSHWLSEEVTPSLLLLLLGLCWRPITARADSHMVMEDVFTAWLLGQDGTGATPHWLTHCVPQCSFYIPERQLETKWSQKNSYRPPEHSQWLHSLLSLVVSFMLAALLLLYLVQAKGRFILARYMLARMTMLVPPSWRTKRAEASC